MTVTSGKLETASGKRVDGLGHKTQFQYLPNPQPWKRGASGNAEFFSTHPECFNDRGFFSYGQFWQAHQPSTSKNPAMKTVSSSFWPFGQRITSVTGGERKEDIYSLDGRIIDRAVPYLPRSRSQPMFIKQLPPYNPTKPLGELEVGIRAYEAKENPADAQKRLQEVEDLHSRFQMHIQEQAEQSRRSSMAEQQSMMPELFLGGADSRGQFGRSWEDSINPAGRGSFSAQSGRSSRSRSSTAPGSYRPRY